MTSRLRYAALSPVETVLLWSGLGQQVSPLRPKFGRSAGLVGRSSAVQAAADTPGELVDEEARCGGINQVDGRVKPGGKAHDDADAQHERGVAAVDGDLWPSSHVYEQESRTALGLQVWVLWLFRPGICSHALCAIPAKLCTATTMQDAAVPTHDTKLTRV